jgi:hypothetical protein
MRIVALAALAFAVQALRLKSPTDPPPTVGGDEDLTPEEEALVENILSSIPEAELTKLSEEYPDGPPPEVMADIVGHAYTKAHTKAHANGTGTATHTDLA